jgi:hypothetical protein
VQSLANQIAIANHAAKDAEAAATAAAQQVMQLELTKQAADLESKIQDCGGGSSCARHSRLQATQEAAQAALAPSSVAHAVAP